MDLTSGLQKSAHPRVGVRSLGQCVQVSSDVSPTRAMALLLIEDNERLAGLLKQGLERTGFRVDIIDTATDAVDALAAIKFEVVILDLGLPDEDGLSVLKTVRQRGAMTPVIVMTARG